jgi:hypothetical protein
MSVCSRGTENSGLESTWRSDKPDEGSDRGGGLTAEPVIRDSAWRKASKSRSLACGDRFVGQQALLQRQGGSSFR